MLSRKYLTITIEFMLMYCHNFAAVKFTISELLPFKPIELPDDHQMNEGRPVCECMADAADRREQ